MKDIKVSELKANLSRYLRMAARGARILVRDREEPIAQIGPPSAPPGTWRERLARDGRLRLGSQAWDRLEVGGATGSADIQESLRAVREDPSEVRRR